MADTPPVFRCYPREVDTHRGEAAIRVLVAFEDDYLVYRETITSVLRVLRPNAEVQSTTIDGLEEALESFDPQVVICGGREDVKPDDRPAWIELSLDPTQPTKIRLGSRYLEHTNPGVEKLLEVIDVLE